MKKSLFFLFLIASFGIGFHTNAANDRAFENISHFNIIDKSRFTLLPQPEVSVITAATPVPGNTVVGAKGEVFAFFDLDATRSRVEDVLLQSLIVSDTLFSGTDYSGVRNLQLWGDPDPRDADTKEVLLATVEYNAQKTEFHFENFVHVKRNQTSRLTLKADVVSVSGDAHIFSIQSGGAKFIGASSGREALVVYSGNGQAQTVHSIGKLLVSASSSRPSSSQLVANMTNNTVMSYQFSTLYEPIEIREFYIATEGNGYASSNVSRVKLYFGGSQIGSTNGYTLDADGKVFVRLESGTMIIPKDDYVTLDIKIDLSDKTQLMDNSTLEIGLGDSDGDNSQWGANGSYGLGNYLMVAKGSQSGSQLLTSTITSSGDAGGYVAGSYTYRLHDGVLTVTLNSSSPSGLKGASSAQEVLRFNLTATGDDITISDFEFAPTNNCYGPDGTAGGHIYLYENGSIQTGTSFATFPAGTVWKDRTQFSVSGDDSDGAMDTSLQVSTGTTKTLSLVLDTTGCTTTNTLQVTIKGTTDLTSGVKWMNRSNNAIDSALTRELPLNGGTIIY